MRQRGHHLNEQHSRQFRLGQIRQKSLLAPRLDYLRYGAYPLSERWREDLALAIGAVLIVWLLWKRSPRRNLAPLLFFVAYPVVAFVLLRGVTSLARPGVLDSFHSFRCRPRQRS